MVYQYVLHTMTVFTEQRLLQLITFTNYSTVFEMSILFVTVHNSAGHGTLLHTLRSFNSAVLLTVCIRLANNRNRTTPFLRAVDTLASYTYYYLGRISEFWVYSR